MKNLYYRRRSPIFSSPARIGGAAVIVAAAILFILRFAAPNFFFAAAAPVFSLGDALPASTGSLFSGFADAAKLTRDVDALTRANEALVNENLALTARLADYASLEGDEEIQGVIAGVVARPPLSPYDVLVVALPPGVMVTQGTRVSGPGGVPIGTVETVAGGYAHIALLSMPERVTDAWVGEERLPLTVVGKGAGVFSAEIARDANVVVGDLVYVAGPGARPIGTVLRVETDPSSPSSRIHIEPLVNLFMITTVLIEQTP